MADKAWTKQSSVNAADAFQSVLDATDFDTEVLKLDPKEGTTIGIQTTGAAVVQLNLYLSDPDTGTAYVFEDAIATSAGIDYIKSNLGPILGLQILGTIAGGDTATIEVSQSGTK